MKTSQRPKVTSNQTSTARLYKSQLLCDKEFCVKQQPKWAAIKEVVTETSAPERVPRMLNSEFWAKTNRFKEVVRSSVILACDLNMFFKLLMTRGAIGCKKMGSPHWCNCTLSRLTSVLWPVKLLLTLPYLLLERKCISRQCNFNVALPYFWYFTLNLLSNLAKCMF